MSAHNFLYNIVNIDFCFTYQNEKSLLFFLFNILNVERRLYPCGIGHFIHACDQMIVAFTENIKWCRTCHHRRLCFISILCLDTLNMQVLKVSEHHCCGVIFSFEITWIFENGETILIDSGKCFFGRSFSRTPSEAFSLC